MNNKMTHTIERVVSSKYSLSAKVKAHKCRLTPKRIILDNGEVYTRDKGTRVMLFTDKVTSMYLWRVVPQSLALRVSAAGVAL